MTQGHSNGKKRIIKIDEEQKKSSGGERYLDLPEESSISGTLENIERSYFLPGRRKL